MGRFDIVPLNKELKDSRENVEGSEGKAYAKAYWGWKIGRFKKLKEDQQREGRGETEEVGKGQVM